MSSTPGPVMPVINEREQIINFLLSQCDQKQRIIEDQQCTIALLQKQLTDINKSQSSETEISGTEPTKLAKPNGKERKTRPMESSDKSATSAQGK